MKTYANKVSVNDKNPVMDATNKDTISSDSQFEFVDNRPEAIQLKNLKNLANNSHRNNQYIQLQKTANGFASQQEHPVQKQLNKTGLPDYLKSGIERLSGYSMDDVRVHYNSTKPSQLQAHAYAQGADIHLAEGQEKHLPHEAWHVVQQKQGRVKPTMQMKGNKNVNDDAKLEKEADIMGAKAMQLRSAPRNNENEDELFEEKIIKDGLIQRKVGFEFETVWDLRKPHDMDWDSDTVIVKGNNWQMSPDEVDGDQAKIEFKTEPVDIDRGDVEDIAEQTTTIFNSLDKYINANLQPTQQDVYNPVVTQVQGAQGVEYSSVGPLKAKPQATGGVRTDLILSFLKDLASDDNDLIRQSRKAKLQAGIDYIDPKITNQNSKGQQETAGVIALLGYYVRRFQADKTKFDTCEAELKEEIRQTYRDYKSIPRSQEERQAKKDELQADYDTRKEALRKRFAPSYAKARASVLPRLAFNDLPGIKYEHLLKHVLRAAGMNDGDGGERLLPLGLKDDEDYPETIAEWITSIQTDRGDDEGELWSARSFGTDIVGSGDKEGEAILYELRSFSGGLEYSEWINFTVPIIAYFKELNMKDKATDE